MAMIIKKNTSFISNKYQVHYKSSLDMRRGVTILQDPANRNQTKV